MSWWLTARYTVYSGTLFGLMFLSIPMTTKTYAQGLPPPPRSYAELNPLFKLHLELVVNQYTTHLVVPVVVKGDEYFIEKSTFDQLNITVNAPASDVEHGLTDLDVLSLGFGGEAVDWVALDKIPELKYDYQSASQSFILDVPAAWMPTQMLGRDTWYQAVTAGSSIGLLNNYDLYTQWSEQGGLNSTLFTEQRFFSAYGTIKNSGIYTQTEQHTAEDVVRNGYRRYDTTWQYDYPAQALSFTFGDIISASKNNWGSAIRIGGLQVQRNYATRPDLITYPLPQFKGQAAVPSTIDLLINGQKVNSAEVQSGPFVLSNVPFINGKGEAVIVTTDTVGRQVMTSVPFYVSNALLKQGLFDYSLSVGKVREHYGVKDFSYGDWAASADWRYGINDWWTAEGRTELADSVKVLGLGSVIKLQNWGVLSASLSQSWADADIAITAQQMKGQQYTVGYSYNRNRFGFSMNHSERDHDFTDLSGLQYQDITVMNRQRNSVANAYYSADKIGTWGVAYIQTQSNDMKTKLMNLSWSPLLSNVMQGVTLSISANHDFVEKDWSASLQLSLPWPSKSINSSMGYQQQRNANAAYVNLNRAVPSQGGVGFDLSHRFNQNADDYSQAHLSYRNRYFNSDIGLSATAENQYWFGLSGSLVWMSNHLFAANRLGESFALIDTNKVADIPVQYENSLIGRSNRNGHIFVPSVTPYYAGKYSIDPIDLASNYNATQVENRMAVKYGSGIIVKFPIKHSLAANVYLKHADGQVLPVGTVIHREAHESSYVGLDGMAYLEDLDQHNRIRVQLPDQRLCQASFDLDLAQAKQQIVVVKDVICHEVQP